MDNEAKREAENAAVIELMRKHHDKRVCDWNVTDDGEVELLDKKDKVLKVIASEELTRLWNIMEGFV